jgi:hypothetical protein
MRNSVRAPSLVSMPSLVAIAGVAVLVRLLDLPPRLFAVGILGSSQQYF